MLENNDNHHLYSKCVYLGCYKSSATISTIFKLQVEKEMKTKITRFSFSEPQDGKSDADRDAAMVKNKIREYVKETKQNVESPAEVMKVGTTKHF